MKKALLFAVMAMAGTAYSQDIYFSGQVGYGLGFPGESTVNLTQDTVATSWTSSTLRFDGGISGGASIGFLFDDGVGLDVAVQYQNNMGSSYDFQTVELQINPDFTVDINEVTTTTTFKTQSFALIPSLRIESDADEIKPFLLVGPRILYSGFKEIMEQTGGSNETYIETKYKSNISIGASATAGVEFELDRDLYLTTAIQFNVGYTSPASSEVTTYEVDGEDMKEFLSTSDLETNYEKEYSTTSFAQDPDEPSTLPRERIDYSSVGLRVGIRMVL